MDYQVVYIVCSILAFIPAIVCHEFMHGFAAYKLGDNTAKQSGRLTLNPLKHIDPFGTIILPLLLAFMHAPVFGYAKPVPYNPNNFKDKRVGDVVVGLAGPAANLVLALIGSALMFALHAQALTTHQEFFFYFYWWFLPIFIMVNLYLMFFNLLPIPATRWLFDHRVLLAGEVPAHLLQGSAVCVPYLLDRAVRLALPPSFQYHQ